MPIVCWGPTRHCSNVRTIKAFGLEGNIISRYYGALTVSTREGIRKAHIGGGAAGATMFITFGGYALVFWYGGTLVGKGEITFDQVMKTLMALMMLCFL
jgi:ATP-binding cassette subfamily B (MDR/TAP) protein 1